MFSATRTPDGIGTNDGIIGVVGVAPWSTLDFCRILYSQINAKKDWHYPRVLVDVNTKIPSRGRHFDLGEQDFSPFIRDSIQNLAAQGACVVVVPCNTAHIYYDRWANAGPVPVPHICQASVAAIKRLGASRVAVLAGSSLHRNDLYTRLLESEDVQVHRLSDQEADLPPKMIEEVKHTGALSHDTTGLAYSMLCDLRAHGVDGLILGCTELTPIEPVARRLISNIVDSNSELAGAAIQLAIPLDASRSRRTCSR